MSIVSDPAEQPRESASTDTQSSISPKPREPEQIYLVPYPKFVFLYPTYVASIIAAIWMLATHRHAVGPTDTTAVVITWLFLGVLAINSIVMAFDFPRGTSLTIFFLLAAVVLGIILAFTLRPEWFPTIARFLESIRPVANATFFCLIVFVMSLIYGAILFSVRFDYWEVRPNELLHHHGLLSDLKRFSAPNLRIDKEVNDVFEYLLLGSGKLILQPSGEQRAIILDNVLFISKKEAAITKMLGALQVELRAKTSS